MNAPHEHEALKAERAMRRRLYDLAESQRWVHHVGNLDSGEILTTPLDRPITPLSRGERLSPLGRRLDPLVFGGPAQRLTPRQHYRPSPEAWLTATGPSSYSPVGETDAQGPGFLSVPVDGSFGVHTVDFMFVPPAAPPHIDPEPVLDPGSSGRAG